MTIKSTYNATNAVYEMALRTLTVLRLELCRAVILVLGL